MFAEPFRYFVSLYLLEFLNLLFNRRYVLLTFFHFYAPQFFFTLTGLSFSRYFAVNGPTLLFFLINLFGGKKLLFFDVNLCILYFVMYIHNLCTLYLVMCIHNLSL
jgi:hypothetical protein